MRNSESNCLWHSKDGVSTRVWCAKWNHRGNLLASCGDDKTVKLWKYIVEPPYLEFSSSLSGSHTRTIRNVAFSPSDKFLASAGFDAAIIIYELSNNEFVEMGKLEGHENEVKCCAFSPSGEFLASCSRDKSVWFWQLDEDGDFQVASILQPHTQDVKFVVWHPAEELLVSCSYDCSVKFYRYDGEDWITQQKIDTAHESTVWAADFSADGESLVTVGGDSVVKVWRRQRRDVAITSSIWHCVLSYKADTRWPLYSVSWSRISGIIAVGGGDRQLRLFKVDECDGGPTLVEYGTKRLFASEINCVSWNPIEANLLAIAMDDGQIRVINIEL
ncbi:putative cytosolic iron-sulfur protein assembly protein CIAO1 -like protein [Toxocara canis]|uniref:Probable cytosolic iron-sulfur protein assembly protein CIAO1 homolog n=1 Tax=Toxocara canis TaxID=6265 RepID=A0A0B2V9T3_TOXCA|nr:putative cytosolic iron-sulfur protein assembly protein CIAO1 -like protein [Toxocara canis]